MSTSNQIVLTLNVPSIEETATWYERIFAWKGHFDTFNEAGQCLFGSVFSSDNPPVGLCLSRSPQPKENDKCAHASAWIYVEDVDVLYRRVLEQGWPVEQEIGNQFWGERTFKLRDCNGFQLTIAQKIEDLGLEEIRKRHQRILKEAQSTIEENGGEQ